MTAYRDMVQMTVTGSPGVAGAITLAAAVAGFQAFKAADDGKTFSYRAQDGAAWVVRKGVYTHAGTSLTQGAYEDSSSGADNINLSSATVVTCVFSAADATGAAGGGALKALRSAFFGGIG